MLTYTCKCTRARARARVCVYVCVCVCWYFETIFNRYVYLYFVYLTRKRLITNLLGYLNDQTEVRDYKGAWRTMDQTH